MDYKFTFEDGSEAYLQHHGVLGMKWGVHNAETKAKYGETAGRPKKTEAEKAADRAQRNAERKKALAYAGLMTGLNFSRTGNLAVAGITFGAAYTSQRISSLAVRKGQPLLDKMIKDPDVRQVTKTVLEAGMTVAGTIAMRDLGRSALSDLLQGASAPTTPISQHTPINLNDVKPGAHSVGGALVNNGVKPHDYSLAQPSSGHGISEQLMNANIPENLKRLR